MNIMTRAAALCATAIVLAGCEATDFGQGGQAGPGYDMGYYRGEYGETAQPTAGPSGELGAQPRSDKGALCAAVPFDQDCRKY